MSTAVYSIDDQQKLPSLSQIIPGQQQGQPPQQNVQVYSPQPPNQQYVAGYASNTPVNANNNPNPEYYYGSYQPQMTQQTQPFHYQGHQVIAPPPPPPQPTMMAGSIQEKCTCKSSANRIPRPRNAFILFRQKHHQLVLDECLVIRTNPEVLRELGRRWRELAPDEKEVWNQLAEEEKKNHAKKYPGYRYTPRRHGKLKNCPVCRRQSMMRALAPVVLSPMVVDYGQFQPPPPNMLQLQPDQFNNPFQSYGQQYIGYDPQPLAPASSLSLYDKLSPLLLGPIIPAAGSAGEYQLPHQDSQPPMHAPVRFNSLPLTNFFTDSYQS